MTADNTVPATVAAPATSNSQTTKTDDPSLVILRKVPYLPSSHERHCVDLYLPAPPAEAAGHAAHTDRPLLVFLHGGAWRTCKPADFTLLATRLAHATGLPVAVPGYRMSLPAKDPNRPIHPAHQIDIEHALTFLTTTGPIYGWNAAQRGLCLIGHSAGSHLATSILLNPKTVSGASLHVRSIVALDGIFDLADMVDEYGEYYRDFTEQAFGPPANWAAASPVYFARDAQRVKDAVDKRKCEAILVVHSREDELLSVRQPNGFMKALVSGNEASGGAIHWVERDYESVRGTHDAMLEGTAVVERIRRFVKERMA
ncbi:Alpha/Beta hydrolase protein [Catenaria anguillulae PL171]|uniref:Alpha/Beta hydrolase protein n=1 Tax=Catenaria anguillulae PL171 TaxID=765915 RepID=A0A1Y2HDI9_9FUNG|nr:Alpha/Beta hydrolase protein [Catenaria anguillulae PL171]